MASTTYVYEVQELDKPEPTLVQVEGARVEKDAFNTLRKEYNSYHYAKLVDVVYK